MRREIPIILLPALILAACNNSATQKSDVEAEAKSPKSAQFVKPLVSGEGTPMEDRVATLGFLNKRNGITQDLEMKPGESRRIGPAIVRLQACERSAPWEPRPETGAFVQLIVETRVSRDQEPRWLKVFSGWLFRESPSINVVEHPIYDVWVKDCAMRFPGDEEVSKPAPSSNAIPSDNSPNAAGSDSTGATTPAAPEPEAAAEDEE